jgi:glycosyltransferase involved in cell wall biosynthesis
MAKPLKGASKVKSVLCVVNHSSAGGAQELWVNIAEGFKARGYEVTLVALYPLSAQATQINRAPADLPWTYIAKQRPTAIGAQLRMLQSLVRFLRQRNADFAFTAMPAANVLVPLAAQLAGCRTKVVISHHGPVSTYNSLLNLVDGPIGAMKKVHRIISVSNTVFRSLDKKPRAYREKRAVIHNALPPEIEKLTSNLASVRVDRKVCRLVVATGRLTAQKNYHVLLRAAVHMPNVQIRIVGGGEDEKQLKEYALKLGVSRRVDFLGFRPRAEALSLLAEGDVFVQPSLYEGHSLALVEAAKLGLPMVVSNVPVQMESITASDGTVCGIGVDPQDDKALADAILRLLDGGNANFQDYATRSTQLASEYRFDLMMDKYEALMRKTDTPSDRSPETNS